MSLGGRVERTAVAALPRATAGDLRGQVWDGQLLRISQNQALFALLGTTYGASSRRGAVSLCEDGSVDRQAVMDWVDGYERAWRTAGTSRLDDLFSPQVRYVPSPWATAVQGLDDLRRFWEANRDGPDEPFVMTHEVVAVERSTAVVRVAVDYHGADPTQWRDLWVLEFGDDGRCTIFEEWPFAPDQPDGH